jgi:hypothetical protein
MVGLIKESSLPDMPEDYQTLEQTEAPLKKNHIPEYRILNIKTSSPEYRISSPAPLASFCDPKCSKEETENRFQNEKWENNS